MIQKKISTTINYINLLSCIFLVVSAISYTSVQQIGFYFFFISYFLEIIIDKKWKNFSFDKIKMYYLTLFLFFLLIFIYHPFENSSKYFLRLVELRLALFGFAVVGFFGLNKLYKLSYIGNAFIFSSVFAMLFLIFGGVGIKEFIFRPQRAELINQMRILYINSHLVFNVYLNISLVFCWYFIFQVKNLSNKKWKISFYIFSIILMLYFLVISEGRMGIITCLCLLFFIIAYKLWKVHKLYVLIFILFAPFIAWLLLSNHKRSTPSEIKKDAHYYIWYAALDVIKDQPIVGYGASRAQEVFDVSMDKFETTRAYKVAWKENKILHCQNQFFQTYMEFGIIGTILLIYLICAPLFIATDKRRALAISLMFIIVAQFTTEIVLTFQGFPVIFGILTLIMLVIKDKNSQ